MTQAAPADLRRRAGVPRPAQAAAYRGALAELAVTPARRTTSGPVTTVRARAAGGAASERAARRQADPAPSPVTSRCCRGGRAGNGACPPTTSRRPGAARPRRAARPRHRRTTRRRPARRARSGESSLFDALLGARWPGCGPAARHHQPAGGGWGDDDATDLLELARRARAHPGQRRPRRARAARPADIDSTVADHRRVSRRMAAGRRARSVLNRRSTPTGSSRTSSSHGGPRRRHAGACSTSERPGRAEREAVLADLTRYWPATARRWKLLAPRRPAQRARAARADHRRRRGAARGAAAPRRRRAHRRRRSSARRDERRFASGGGRERLGGPGSWARGQGQPRGRRARRDPRVLLRARPARGLAARCGGWPATPGPLKRLHLGAQAEDVRWRAPRCRAHPGQAVRAAAHALVAAGTAHLPGSGAPTSSTSRRVPALVDSLDQHGGRHRARRPAVRPGRRCSACSSGCSCSRRSPGQPGWACSPCCPACACPSR